MKKLMFALGASALSLSTLVAPMAAVPAQAAVVNNTTPDAFIASLGVDSLAVLKTGNKAAVRAKFRELLSTHFAIDAIGNRLIQRSLPTITPEQKAAYKAAFPSFIIGTYSDNLYDYATASMKVIRSAPAGSGWNVTSTIQKPGAQPITAVWSVAKVGGVYQVTNLTVANINLAITQSQDFNAIIQRKGFDGLVAMMKSRG